MANPVATAESETLDEPTTTGRWGVAVLGPGG
jgi:hypothetical protein